ncbi:hypothetical protein D9M71_612350 [compost metagenome]
MVAARLEHHLALGGNVNARDLYHLHHPALLEVGVQLALLRTRAACGDQAIGLGALVVQGEVGGAGRGIGRQLARPRVIDGQLADFVLMGKARQDAGQQGGQGQGTDRHGWCSLEERISLQFCART